MGLSDQIIKERLPRHIAIIMDGNGRWARERGKDRLFGHIQGVESVRNIVEGAAELGVEYLTLYAFSTENWDRPEDEVSGLMELLVNSVKNELPTLRRNNIRLHVIGDSEMLPPSAGTSIKEAVEATAANTGMNLIMALSYSSYWEIIRAVKSICNKVTSGEMSVSDIDVKSFHDNLATAVFPDPELMIRTSGEYRISNFLLFQLAYSELYFTETLWPDFRKDHLYEAIINFQKRERRFGKTSEQIKTTS